METTTNKFGDIKITTSAKTTSKEIQDEVKRVTPNEKGAVWVFLHVLICTEENVAFLESTTPPFALHHDTKWHKAFLKWEPKDRQNPIPADHTAVEGGGAVVERPTTKKGRNRNWSGPNMESCFILEKNMKIWKTLTGYLKRGQVQVRTAIREAEEETGLVLHRNCFTRPLAHYCCTLSRADVNDNHMLYGFLVHEDTVATAKDKFEVGDAVWLHLADLADLLDTTKYEHVAGPAGDNPYKSYIKVPLSEAPQLGLPVSKHDEKKGYVAINSFGVERSLNYATKLIPSFGGAGCRTTASTEEIQGAQHILGLDYI